MVYAKQFKVKVAQSMVSRAFKNLSLRRKKSVYAMEQDRAEVKEEMEERDEQV